jgi:tRNA(fMet)-specific endonuclease VapC
MPLLMLDTNICIYTIKHHPPEVRRRLEAIAPRQAAISSIVAAELWTGVMKSQRPRQNETALTEFLNYLAVLDWPAEAGKIYGALRARLESEGQPIGAMDMLIAAHALHARAVLVTNNQREFRRVPGLALESWVRR